MAEHNLTPEQLEHVESHAPYLTVGFILLNYTIMEYIYASFYESRLLSVWMVVASLAITLITLIAAKWLHIEFNRKWFYLTIIPALALSFFRPGLVLGLMFLAVTKASLVGYYFMHLKFEGRWVYYMLIPAAILATVFIVALYPDIGMEPGAEENATPDSEEVAAAPAMSWPVSPPAYRS